MDLSTVTSIVFGNKTADTMSIGGTVVWRRPITLTLTKSTGIATIYYKIGNGSWISASGNVTIGYGLTVYMYATASSGYTYSAYTQSNPLTVTMTGAYTYNPVASFQVVLSKNFNGTLRWSGDVSGTSTANSYTITISIGQSVQVWASCSDGYYHANYNSGNKKTVTSAQTVSFTQSLNSITINYKGGVLRLNNTISKFKNQWDAEYIFSSSLSTGDYLVGSMDASIKCYVAQGSNGSVQFAQGQGSTAIDSFPTSSSLYSSVKTGGSWDSGTPTAFMHFECYLYVYRAGSGTKRYLRGFHYNKDNEYLEQISERISSGYYIPNSFTTYNFYNS